MKKIFGLAIVSMAFLACNDNESPSINEDTRDTSTTAIETPAPATDNVYVPMDGDITYRDNKVHVMRNGAWVEADKDVNLDNGVVVYRTGKVKKDGREVELEDGVVVTRDGNFFDRTGRAIEDAWDATKEGVKKAGNEIEKGAEKAGDKANDAVHDDDHDDKK